MIIGTGIDLVDVRKMEEAVTRWRDRFLNRIFTPGEREYCLSKKDPYPHLAARFAAKEAVKKALASVGLSSTSFHDIEVLRGESGEPQIKMADFKTHVSLSHHGDYAVASVLIEGC